MMGHAGMAATAVRFLHSADPLPPPELRCVREDERAPIAPSELRRVLSHFASGVTVITSPATDDDPSPAGFACQSFASLSLTPPLVAFMVARTSTTWPRIARAGVFCVNILGDHQAELCRAFAISGADKFAGVTHTPAPSTGSPLLDGAPAWIDCTIHTVHTGGDHLIVVGRVQSLDTPAPNRPPLLFFRGGFGSFCD
ncbi:flavin reductase family protein [Streptomyces gobiensis]|uniref:flavin reductase family protein n=1 Tax=Streptomyces gobiensis TaxID=2875706 RepID=UPI001E3BC116|nr:flavin reductase family protein [Streptomyces gobiensis]UGY92017.1 flavin reductase family protein [Streptomyces gobiensis]